MACILLITSAFVLVAATYVTESKLSWYPKVAIMDDGR